MIEQTKQYPLMRGMTYIMEAIFDKTGKFERYETVHIGKRKNFRQSVKALNEFVLKGNGTYKIF